jgi:histone H3/H4
MKEATTVQEKTLVGTAKAGVIGDKINLSNLADIWIAETRPNSYYDDTPLENFNRIPYNHIDEGRYVVGIPRASGAYDIIIAGDPRIDKDCKENLCKVLERYAETIAKNLTKLTGTTIKDNKNTMRYEDFESSVTKESQDVKPLQIRLKALKKMVDEYQYIVKKQEAVGTDVKISDKVVYNHKEGKVSYNDFSIAINDEMLKGRLFQAFEKYLVTYYRGETTEETILNDILDKIFEELKARVNSFSSENTTIKIVLNECITVDLEIKTSKNKSKLLYLNGQRFNKNEVLTVLREITCYRNQEEANRFISNIGKLGLSVYIGITTGYEATIDGNKKLFRFKKLKGRSNYTLLLDTIEIGIKGKDLINTLFSQFIGDRVPDFQGKVPKLIFESVESSADYVKYKFLIDTAYEAFKARSEEFLKKKVSDVGGEFCKYFNTNGKRIMSAISLTGMSGRKYIIAYDAKNSYVFLDPQVKQGEKNTYEEGKYVCMIDQSNIKSNIGYDTVISKLLALKNDSVIARNIYNLEEEINEPGTDEGRNEDTDRENDPE